jgi:hypothetical protein
VSTIEVRFRPMTEDVVEGARGSSSPWWVTWLFVLLLSLLFLIGLILIDLHHTTIGSIWLALSVVFGFAVYEAPVLEARRSLASNPSAQGEIVITMDDRGVTMTFPTGHSVLQWRAFTRYKETGKVFLIFGSNRGTCIPKRVMSDEQIQQVRGLLSSRVSKP